MATWLEKIEKGNKTLMDLFEQGKHKEIGDLYTEDCSVMPPGVSIAQGREETVKVFQGAADSGITSIELNVKEVGPIADGNTAYERGELAFKKADGSAAFEGKYLVIWKEIEGKPFLHIDTWNSTK